MARGESQHSRLSIELFGEFNYQIGDKAFQSLKSRKTEAVLLALALSGEGGLSRKLLVELLWPELTNKGALAGLRQALARIRRLFPYALIVPRPGWIALSRLHVRCDYWDLLFSIKAQKTNRFHIPTNPILTTFPTPTPEFEDWVLRKKRTGLESLRTKLDSLIKQSDIPSNVRDRACQVQIMLSETEEPLIATVLDFYRETDQHADYSRLRLTYIEQLEKQLGLQPSAEFLSEYAEPLSKNVSTKSEVSPLEFTEKRSEAPVLEISETFRIRSQNEDISYLSESIPMDIMSRLTRQNWFDVRLIDPDDLKKPKISDLMNSYHLDGTIHALDDTLAVTVRLRNRLDGTVPWSHKFSGSIARQEETQAKVVDIMAETILTKLVDAVADDATRLATSFPESVWITSMKARNLFWQTSPEKNLEARQLLDPIIDQNFAPVSAMVTATFTRLLAIWSGWNEDPDTLMKDAMRISERAVRLYPTDPWSHFCLATCFCASREHTKGLRTINRALDLHDSFASGLGLRGHMLVFCGETSQARKDLKQSIRLNPLDPHLGLWLNTFAMLEYLEGHYEAALEWSTKAISVSSYWSQFYTVQACIFDALGRTDEAQQSFDIFKKLTPNINRQNWIYSHPCGTPEIRDAFEARLIKYGL